MSLSHQQTGKLTPQTMLRQRYLIVRSAGRGGMATVYQAIDTLGAHQHVAIKEMSQSRFEGDELVQAMARFQHEASMLGALAHPNLPRIHAAFSEQGRSYLVMDYIEGKTLLEILREAHAQPLPIMQVLHYARQLCQVLGYLHQHQPPIIFRDTKPTNVMVTHQGHVFLIDFGIARFFKEGQEQDTVLLGSPGYAAPEQHGLSQSTPRSDIYGLGATLHYCLTGRDPYYAQRTFTFPSLSQFNPQVPIELEQLILHMVAENEQDRPGSAFEVLQALNALNLASFELQDTTFPATQTLQPVSPVQEPLSYDPVWDQPASQLIPNQFVTPPTMLASPLHSSPTTSIAPLSAQAIPLHTSPTTSMAAPSIAITPSIPIWNGGFSRLFGLLFLITLGSSAYALNTFSISENGYGGTEIVEAVLWLLFWFIAGTRLEKIKGFIPHFLLIVSALTALITGVAALGLGSIALQNAPGALLSSQPQLPVLLYQILTIGSNATSIISLNWLLRPPRAPQRTILRILFGTVAFCMLFQVLYSESSLIKHILFLIALIALIQGTLLATEVEYWQNNPEQARNRRLSKA